MKQLRQRARRRLGRAILRTRYPLARLVRPGYHAGPVRRWLSWRVDAFVADVASMVISGRRAA